MTTVDTRPASSERVDQAPLSYNQEFLCLLDKGDAEGPFGPKYTVVFGWRLTGPLELGAFQAALDDVVVRHEALRTVMVREQGNQHQAVHPPAPTRLTVQDLSGTAPADREQRAEQFLNDLEPGDYPAAELPVLRALLGRFDDRDAVLVLVLHHTTTDSWSMQVVIRELAECYAARTEQRAAQLPEVRQYRDYAVAQRARLADPSTADTREYWREKLRDGVILALPTDRPQSAKAPKVTAVLRFRVDEEITAAALAYARVTRSTPFIVLLAAYNVLMLKRTGVTDLVIPTITSGRTEPEFQDTIGMFFNFVPLRVDVAGCRTFREVVERTRPTCIEAYLHDLPFAQIAAEAPSIMQNFGVDGKSVLAFEVFQFPTVMSANVVGGIEYSEIRRRLLPQAESSEIPDGALWTLDIDPSGDMVGSLKYTTDGYDAATMSELVDGYRDTLAELVRAPDAPLRLG